MSDASRHTISAAVETTYGTTPATPQFSKIRHTGTTLGLTKSANTSAELRADRQIADFRHGTKQVGGDISFELSYSSFDALLEAVLCGTWTTNVLKAGIVRRSFSVLREFGDIAPAGKPFHLYTGVVFNNFQLTITPDAIITGSFNTIGQGLALSTTAPVGTTYVEPPATEVFDSFNGSLLENGVEIAIVTELNMTLENGVAPRFVTFSDETILPQIGKSNLTGSISLYFEDATMYEKFIQGSPSSLVFTLIDTVGNSYEFSIPNIVYNGGQPDVSEGAITLTMPFQAVYDATDATNITITRIPA